MAVSEPSAVKYHAGSFIFEETRTQCGRSSAQAAASCGRSFYVPSRRSPSYWSAFGPLQSSRVIPRDLSQKVWNWIEADQLSDKLVMALEQNSPLGKLLAIGLANRNKPRALMVERLEDGGRHVVHELERFLNTLGTIAAVAPLLGLLGTVAGIIHAFNAITANGIGDPRILVRRHRRGAHHDGGGIDRRHSLADRLSLSARQGRAPGRSHGKRGHEAGRRAGRARHADRGRQGDEPAARATAKTPRST